MDLTFAGEWRSLGSMMEPEQVWPVVSRIREMDAPRVCVFGVGHDSLYWDKLTNGNTLFVEDVSSWADRFSRLNIRRVKYPTKQRNYKRDAEIAEVLDVVHDLSDESFDVVVVDGPMGYAPDTAGRVLSIYAASRLIKSDGMVAVHDSERELERYCIGQFFDRPHKQDIADRFGRKMSILT